MRLLVVEDDEHKLTQLRAFLHEIGPLWVMEEARSVQSGYRSLENFEPDLLILDMSLPVYDYSLSEDGFSHLSYGGRDIFEYLDFKKRHVPVIVLTAFDRFGSGADAVTLAQLGDELQKNYPTTYIGSVWYSAVVDEWKKQLSDLLAIVFQKKKG